MGDLKSNFVQRLHDVCVGRALLGPKVIFHDEKAHVSPRILTFEYFPFRAFAVQFHKIDGTAERFDCFGE